MNKWVSSKIIFSLSVLIFFSSILLSCFFSGFGISVIWYFSLGICTLLGTLICIKTNRIKEIIIMAFIFLSGQINILYIGSTDFRAQLLLLTFFAVSFLFSYDSISSSVFLFICYLNSFAVIFQYLKNGFYGNIYLTSSINFVSVYLLSPLVLFYVKKRNAKQISLFPICIVWVLCLLSRGRGGIITSTFLFLSLFIIQRKKQEKGVNILIFLFIFLILIIALLYLPFIVGKISKSLIWETFRNRGLKSSRIVIWNDYLKMVFSSPKYFFLGGKLSQTVAFSEYEGNLHNSFLNIHCYNGLLSLLLVIGICLKKLIELWKKKEYIYFVCFLTIILRSLTDNVFWPAYETPVLFFFLFDDSYIKGRPFGVEK